jgi:hypothetical protein
MVLLGTVATKKEISIWITAFAVPVIGGAGALPGYAAPSAAAFAAPTPAPKDALPMERLIIGRPIVLAEKALQNCPGKGDRE